MRARPTRIPRDLLLRRRLLKGLGALAISAPALSVFGCGSSAGKDDGDGVLAQGSGGTNAANTSLQGSGGAASSATTGASAGAPGSGGMPAGTGGAAAGSGGMPAGTGGAGAGGASPMDAGTGTGGAAAVADAGAAAMVPMFDDAASCMLTKTDIEGPFFIDDSEIPDDESLVRSDVREGMHGCEYRMHFRLLDADKDCAPIANAEMYMWHCNADGYYSGFNGQDPTKPYMGSMNPAPMNLERFCRGVQVSDNDGIVTFITVYPGWYAGRPIHVHLVARIPGQTTRLITTQLYYPAAFTKEVHESEPAYMARAAAIPAGSLNPPAGSPAMMTLTHTPGLVVGTLNVIVKGA